MLMTSCIQVKLSKVSIKPNRNNDKIESIEMRIRITIDKISKNTTSHLFNSQVSFKSQVSLGYCLWMKMRKAYIEKERFISPKDACMLNSITIR